MDGKTIEARTNSISEWIGTTTPKFDLLHEYRIKPEPKYRPFKNTEECWQEMQKHQPFGWIKPTDDLIPGKFMIINRVRTNEVSITSGINFAYNELLKYYTFADGTPLGVEVEE